MNSVPKFGKVEILLKPERINYSTQLQVFEDCGLVITGNYLIVIIDERDEKQTSVTTTSRIFDLGTVHSYKTHAI